MNSTMQRGVKYSPEFMSNLLTRLNSTVGKNPMILQPFLKHFSNYHPQPFEAPIYPPYAMPRPLPLANDFLLPFSNYCRQPYFHQNDGLMFRQHASQYDRQINQFAPVNQYQTTQANGTNIPTHSLIEHIAQTMVKPSYLPFQQHLEQQAQKQFLLQNSTPKTVSMVEKPTFTQQTQNQQPQQPKQQPEQQPQYLQSLNQPITIQDLIASLLEQPNNLVLQQQAQPILQALISQFHNSSLNDQFGTANMYQPIEVITHKTTSTKEQYKPLPTPTGTIFEKSTMQPSQAFKPYKRNVSEQQNTQYENQFQPINKPIGVQDQKTTSMVAQPMAYNVYEQHRQIQNPYFSIQQQNQLQFTNQQMYRNVY